MTQAITWTPPGGAVAVPLGPPSYAPQPDREGFDTIPAELYDSRAPYQDGATPLGGSFEPREIFLPLVLIAQSSAEMAALRRATTRLFAPNRGVGVLSWTQDDGTTWVIRAEPVEGVAFGPRDEFDGFRVRAEISLIAKDPFWYEPTLSTVAVGMYDGGAEFPLEFPFDLGTATGIAMVQNNGDVATPCTLTLAGPATNPAFHNATTGDTWYATLALLPGEQLIVTSKFGEKTAVVFDPVTGRSENAFGAVNPASRWIELVPGENRIGMTLSEEASRATMTIAWYNRYLGA